VNLITNNTDKFTSVSLKDMDNVKLMNRTDTKFAFSVKKLSDLFNKIIPFYNILEIDNKRIHYYRSLYFDTSDRKFYNDHHNQRVNRHKVRFREYVDSGLKFLEIKHKTNKGKTVKKRIKVKQIDNELSIESKEFINKIIGSSHDMVACQWINFKRITLVHKLLKERLTLDLDLSFYNDQSKGDLKEVIIAEVKQERMSRESDFIRLSKEMGIHPIRISKYCYSSFELDNSLKHNRFKEKRMYINKLKQE